MQWRCFIGQVGTIVRPTLQWKAHSEGGLGQHVHKREVAGRIREKSTYEVQLDVFEGLTLTQVVVVRRSEKS